MAAQSVSNLDRPIALKTSTHKSKRGAKFGDATISTRVFSKKLT